MSCTAISHIRFVEELAKPPSDRPRDNTLAYPRVAQIKGDSDRQSSYDLLWKLETLSAACELKPEANHQVLSPVPKAVAPPRSPGLGRFDRSGEKTTASKLPSTPLTNLLHEETLFKLCTPPLLCSTRFPDSNGSSTDGASAYSSASSSSGSDF